MEFDHDDVKWPSIEPQRIQRVPRAITQSPTPQTVPAPFGNTVPDYEDECPLRACWESIRAKHADNTFLPDYAPKLDDLPSSWAVVSFNVTDDRNTMFLSRHQKGHQPVVFCMPLDRQGRREGEEDLFTFDIAKNELDDILRLSNEASRGSKHIVEVEAKAAWWAHRRALDRRLEELLANLEFCWLGAFKVSYDGWPSADQQTVERISPSDNSVSSSCYAADSAQRLSEQARENLFGSAFWNRTGDQKRLQSTA